MVKNPNRQEANQLAIYKCGRGVELGATEKQRLLAARTGLEPGTSGFQVRRPNPLDHAASIFPFETSHPGEWNYRHRHFLSFGNFSVERTKGLFTWREEDPSTRNFLEDGTTFRLVYM